MFTLFLLSRASTDAYEPREVYVPETEMLKEHTELNSRSPQRNSKILTRFTVGVSVRVRVPPSSVSHRPS